MTLISQDPKALVGRWRKESWLHLHQSSFEMTRFDVAPWSIWHIQLDLIYIIDYIPRSSRHKRATKSSRSSHLRFANRALEGVWQFCPRAARQCDTKLCPVRVVAARQVLRLAATRVKTINPPLPAVSTGATSSHFKTYSSEIFCHPVMSNPSAGTSSTPSPSGNSSSIAGSTATKKDALSRLLQKQLEEIDSVSQKIDLWKKYTKDYEDLKRLIDQMQDKVKHPYRIPIAGTKLAFVDGHIVHTNEFHVLLGCNYFALRSARQATQIIDRRLVDLKEWLKQSEEAKRKAQDWLTVTSEHKRDKEEFVEIIETL